MKSKPFQVSIVYGYISFALLILFIGGFIFYGTHRVNSRIELLSTELIHTNELLHSFRQSNINNQLLIHRHIHSITDSEKDSIQTEISKAIVLNDFRLHDVKNLLNDSIALFLFNDLEYKRNTTIAFQQKLFNLSKLNKDSAEKFNMVIQGAANEKFSDAFEKLSDYIIHKTHDESIGIRMFVNSMQIILYFLLTLTLVVLLALGRLILISKQRLIVQNELLKESETKFRLLVEAMPDAVIATNKQGNIIFCNDKSLSLFGYDSKELINNNIDILIPDRYKKNHPNHTKKFHQHSVNKVVGNAKAPLSARRKDGTEFYAEISLNGFETKNGLSVISVVHEITDIINAQEQIKKSDAFNKGILNSMSSHIAVINSAGIIVAVNEAWIIFGKVFGNTTLYRAAIGENYFDVCHKEISDGNEYSEKALNGIQAVLNHEVEIFTMEYPCHSPGIERWSLLKVMEFKSEEQMVVIAHENITGRKIAELDRVKITADLVQRNKDLEQFAYIVSHNLRAPVANILGLTSTLSNPDLADDYKIEFTKGLNISVGKLDEVIRDINNILQVRREVNERKEKINLLQLVANIKHSISSVIEFNNAVIITNFTGLKEINSIKSYIYSIFYNLIVNSIKYRKRQTPPLIEIKTELENNKIRIYFKDNGIGFDLSKNKEKIFGLYKRFNPEIEGKGLGLYMVKVQVESLGGTIKLQSELNRGSEFVIEFVADKMDS